MKTVEQRESYRERLYQHYLAHHSGTDLQQARTAVRAALPYFKRLIGLLPQDRNTRILDLGCGYGSLLYSLKEAGYRSLEGIDRSPEQVEGAHCLGLDFVEQEDIMGHLARRRSASSDVVIAFDVLEHFSKDEALRFVDEAYRILVPGGILVLHLPNGEGFLSGSVAFGDFTHELILNRKSVGQLLRCAGFAEVRVYEDTPVVHGIFSAVRFVVWKIARTILRLVYVAQTGESGSDLVFSQNLLAVARREG